MDNSLKIVQTLYLPQNGNDPLLNTLGFLSPEFNWMGWALSCLQLKKFYPEVELYTNAAGREVLINRLRLPYDGVHILNDMDFPKQLWAYPKLYTYSVQNSPFLHVDGDAFFWERLSAGVLQQPLIAQNIEINGPYYWGLLKYLESTGVILPESIRMLLAEGIQPAAFNAGILGGTDTGFIKAYTAEAFGFVNTNYQKLESLNLPEVNMIFEQVLFYSMSRRRNTGVTCYLDEEITDMTYPGFADFENAGGDVKYIHLMGAFKQNPDRCYRLAERLRHDYPDHYYRIITECQKAGVNMFLSCYNAPAPDISIGFNTNWKSIYEHEKAQFARTDDMFKDNKLSAVKFKTSKFLQVGKPAEDAIKYMLPVSYRMAYEEITPDQLDEVLIELLGEPRSFGELQGFIAEYFDDSDLEESIQAIKKLLTIKLRKGLYQHLYEIC